MDKEVFLISFLILLLQLFGDCSKCTYDGSVLVICSNVSSDLVLEIDHENVTKVDQLEISEGSEVPIILMNSSLSSFPALKKLTLRFLGIKKISPGAFISLSKLEELDLSLNKLEEISTGTFNGLVQLKTLFLQGNILKKILPNNFNNLKTLNYLDLSSNLIGYVDDQAFSNLEALENLDLSKNNLTILPENVFSNLNQLSTVDLSANPLTVMHDFKFGNNVKTLSIDVSYTDMISLDFGLQNKTLHSMRSSNTLLEEIDFVKLPAIFDYLDLHENHIKKIRNFHLAYVESINLNENNITELDSLSQNVANLFLSKNYIQNFVSVTDPEKYRIKTLDLSYNKLDTASCFGLSGLLYLHLDHNQITTVKGNSFDSCTNLSDLNLSNNKIEVIEPNAFSGAKLLVKINLSHNKLKTLNVKPFFGLKQLSDLYFDNNDITYFDVESFMENSPKLKWVTIENQYSCQDLKRIIEQLKWYNVRSLDVTYTNCSSNTVD